MFKLIGKIIWSVLMIGVGCLLGYFNLLPTVFESVKNIF